MTWERGRKLSTMTFADGSTTSYKYNADGIRTQKTVNGVTTDYFLEGSTIVAQKTGNDVIWYYFDGDGTRDAIEYGGKVYYYMYNPQGDVIGLFDDYLNVVVEYTYDSWGKVKTTGTLKDTLGKANPFRYRGYYYDEESGMYYLNSRYYHPEIGRFINADSVISGDTSSVQGYNLFAYCFNNPVNMSDGNGNWPKWTRGKFAENVSRAVSNVLAFARELLVNTFTDNAATTLSQYAKKYLHIVMPSAFMNQGLAAVRVTGEVNSLSGIPSVSAQIVRNTAKNGIPIATTIIDFGIQIANGENVLNAGVKSISHTAIGIGSAKIGMGIGTFIGGPLGTVAGGAIGLVLGTGGQIVFDIFFDKAKRS